MPTSLALALFLVVGFQTNDDPFLRKDRSPTSNPFGFSGGSDLLQPVRLDEETLLQIPWPVIPNSTQFSDRHPFVETGSLGFTPKWEIIAHAPHDHPDISVSDLGDRGARFGFSSRTGIGQSDYQVFVMTDPLGRKGKLTKEEFARHRDQLREQVVTSRAKTQELVDNLPEEVSLSARKLLEIADSQQSLLMIEPIITKPDVFCYSEIGYVNRGQNKQAISRSTAIIHVQDHVVALVSTGSAGALAATPVVAYDWAKTMLREAAKTPTQPNGRSLTPKGATAKKNQSGDGQGQKAPEPWGNSIRGYFKFFVGIPQLIIAVSALTVLGVALYLNYQDKKKKELTGSSNQTSASKAAPTARSQVRKPARRRSLPEKLTRYWELAHGFMIDEPREPSPQNLVADTVSPVPEKVQSRHQQLPPVVKKPARVVGNPAVEPAFRVEQPAEIVKRNALGLPVLEEDAYFTAERPRTGPVRRPRSDESA